MVWMTRTRCVVAVAMALLVTAGARYAGATAVDLTPLKDNTLIESPLGNSNGAGDGLFAGRVATFGGGTKRRGLLAFDLASIPADATIDSVTLTMTMAQTNNPAPIGVALHRLSADWGEAGSFGSGQGGLAEAGDATWIHRNFDTVAWATSGGDFEPAASAVTPVAGAGAYTWSAPGLVADVGSWLASPSANFGWIVIGGEDVQGTVKKFFSRESLTRPTLRIVYTEATTGVEAGTRAGGVHFAPAAPSPATGPVRLGYTLPATGRVSLTLLDAAGREVRTLVPEAVMSSGTHAHTWDTRDTNGRPVAPGLYLARLVVDGRSFARRVAIVR